MNPEGNGSLNRDGIAGNGNISYRKLGCICFSLLPFGKLWTDKASWMHSWFFW
jgi:hypothetical protein